MAAAAWIRSEGVAGVRTTKGLFFIFTLLSLVWFASSFLDKDQLTKLKETHQKLKHDLERLKDEHMPKMATHLDHLTESTNLLDSMIALVKNYENDFPDDFPSMSSLLEKAKVTLEKTEIYLDKKNDNFRVKLDDMEGKMKEIEKLINFLEEQQAEL
ncbi:uncharacterized protein PAE49_021600 [Odontesthes bonariensis]